MAKIPVEKETGAGGWWKWLLGIVFVGLLIWLLIALIDTGEEEVAVEPAMEEATPEEFAEPTGVTIGDILGSPEQYVGEPFPSAEVTVATDREITDRGFWIQEGGSHLFTIIVDRPVEQPKDINPGATLRIDEGTIRQPDYLADLQGDPLDQETESIVNEQEIFLVANEANIHVLQQGNPQPGTDPAEGL